MEIQVDLTLGLEFLALLGRWGSSALEPHLVNPAASTHQLPELPTQKKFTLKNTGPDRKKTKGIWKVIMQ